MGDEAKATDYVFDNAGEQVKGRFQSLETLYDAHTQRHIEARGICPGWVCLEIGGGSGSIADWMAQRVRPGGSVLVTDINPRFLEHLSADNLAVRVHDIGNDPLDRDSFDLIHTRLVLMHVPQRDAAVRHMVEALKPGGWLVLEEYDAQSLPPNAVRHGEHFLKIVQAMQRATFLRGVDNEFGRRLPAVMRAAGVENVEAEGRIVMFSGGSAGAAYMRANVEQLKDDMLATGLISEREFTNDLDRLDDPQVRWPAPIMWSAWGQKRE